jgi:hypothetical protein
VEYELPNVALQPKRLKDAYFLLTTESGVLQRILGRSREHARRAVTFLGTLFKTKVPRCAVAHQKEQMQQKHCDLWSCQVEAIIHSAVELSVKLEQRCFETIFQWPQFGEKFEKTLMKDENMEVGVIESEAVINVTYMPAVIDKVNSQDPAPIDGGAWYKARISLQERGKGKET